MTEDGNLIFESSDLVSGCYTVKSLETDGYSVDFEAIGINSQFGIDTVVMDLNADAYAEDSDNSNSDNENTGSEVYDAVVINPDETSTQAAGNTISEAIAAAADVQQNNLFRASSAVNVVLDPGHGGNDGGAQASYGGKTYLEKTLNLKIAQYCKEELSKYKRVNVYMTRNDDHYVALEDRVNYAKSVGASVFVSIHNNSTTSSSVHGATVYYPNSSLNANIGAQGGALANEVLKQLVALGLANDGTRIRNSESGDTYTDGSICDYYSVIRNSKKAGFPGIIIEHAYISNQSDATNYLGSETALKKLGIADAQGIVNYFGLKQEDYHLIFDASYYLNNNPDVKNNWGNTAEAALQHFIKYGMAEGRRGNEIFDVHFYKDNNIDLQNAFGDNWYLYYQHYLENGIREGRQASENFDVISYKTRYRDLQSAFGDDYEGYVDHYISYGINEERDASPLRYKVDFVDNGQIVESQNVLCMRGAKAPEITKTGYVLSWDKAYNKIASDTTVNAVWTPVTVKLNYDAAGGNLTNTSKNITYGGTYGDLESPERDGYTFTGWYTAANGGTQITKDTKVEVTSDQTIYAHWTANQLNFANQTITKTFSTNAQTANITDASNGTGSYTYTEKTETNASGTATNYISINGTTINIAANTPAGTYTYVITATDNGSKVTKDATYTITIGKAAATNPTLSNTTLTYNGAAQYVTVSGGYGGTIYYRTSTNNSSWGSWTTTKPSLTDVGTIYVQAYVAGDGNHNNTGATGSVTLRMNPKSVAVTWGTTTTFTYNENAQAPTAAATSGVANETINVTRTTGTNAGSYTSTASISSVTGGRARKENYTLTGNTKAFTINKVAATNPTLKTTTAKYDKNAHAITVSGGSGGTIYYRTSTDNKTWGSWSTTKPTRTSIGTTYVQAYVVGDGNHTNTSATGSATITITKPTAADVSYTPSDSSWKVENVKQALDALYNR